LPAHTVESNDSIGVTLPNQLSPKECFYKKNN